MLLRIPPLPPQRYTAKCSIRPVLMEQKNCEPDTCLDTRNDEAEGFIKGCLAPSWLCVS